MLNITVLQYWWVRGMKHRTEIRYRVSSCLLVASHTPLLVHVKNKKEIGRKESKYKKRAKMLDITRGYLNIEGD